ncbi:sulfite exporter TauE/SafE family protein [Bdellovibrio reynosensis]|uniref:Sulfite exporter TauE/SafE family protein n=1 Tax=Bdellovibrio reynosensis TaxID=2835041 RepID=A0ABY4C9A4_9BACT|nr:sulfite exporter TauE/SafE family protein [Bdellovibrio reynosensis]UOF01566.1 sulfite exporter TauE/SafE family protein [Bdellovibrio reynosensis]
MNTSLILALGIISSSFIGSWHCAGMCGPIASLMSTRKTLWSYHLGRMISYIVLGVMAGFFGNIFLKSQFVELRWISAILLSGFLFVSGTALLFPKLQIYLSQFSVSHFALKLIKKLQAFHLKRSGVVVGLLTALLPCGWLYTYVMAAVATQSPESGGLTMLLFWLGGLPVLCTVPLMVRSTINSAGLNQKRIAGGILIAASIYSLISFFYLH